MRPISNTDKLHIFDICCPCAILSRLTHSNCEIEDVVETHVCKLREGCSELGLFLVNVRYVNHPNNFRVLGGTFTVAFAVASPKARGREPENLDKKPTGITI